MDVGYIFFSTTLNPKFTKLCVRSVYLTLLWNESGKVGLCLDVKESMFEQGKKKFRLLIAEDEKEFRGVSSVPKSED